VLFSRDVVVVVVVVDGCDDDGRESLVCVGEEGGMFSSCVGLLKASFTTPLLPIIGFFFN